MADDGHEAVGQLLGAERSADGRLDRMLAEKGGDAGRVDEDVLASGVTYGDQRPIVRKNCLGKDAR